MADGIVARTTCQYDWLDMDGSVPIGTHGTVSIVAPDGTALWEWSNIDAGDEALHHDIEVMPNGNILVISWQVLEASPARQAGWVQQGAPPQIDWHFNADGRHEIYAPFMSGAQRMENGNTLMMQACDKRVLEVTPQGEIVLDFHVEGPGRMFRIYKFAPDDLGIRALGL